MLGGRLFWFCIGIGVGLWARSWIKRNLRRKNLQRQVLKKVKSFTQDLKVAISEGKRPTEQNGY